MVYLVGPKGQVVISKEIRDSLGIGPGWLALQRLAGDHVEVRFVPPRHDKSLMGSLGRYVKTSVPPGKDWDKARTKGWRKAARDKVPTSESAG